MMIIFNVHCTIHVLKPVRIHIIATYIHRMVNDGDDDEDDNVDEDDDDDDDHDDNNY